MTQEETLQSCLADFPANQYQQQGNALDQKMKGGCGASFTESSAKLNHLGLLLKIVTGCTLFQSGKESKPIWKAQVMKSNVIVYRLQAWVHRMSEKERLLLPTPKETEYKRAKIYNLTPKAVRDYLVVRVAVLEDILKENLPTPTCQEMTFRKTSPSETPQGSRRGCGLGAEVAKRAPYLIGKRIHPNFVEWMMGFPEEWTNLDCRQSGMQLCHECFTRSSVQSEQSKN